MSTYPFTEIETKWQEYWEENNCFKVDEDPKFSKEKRKYVLDMFPYPSGSGLHVGHPEGYTATDIYCRYLRMNSFNVLHPMGFDSFGLPAENYAIKTGTHPGVTTKENIAGFRKQIKRLGFSYDWDREVSTHEASYYKWTQWIFLKLFKKGLAYEAKMPINWCDDCKTGLANEEVKDGCCERCGNTVERKNIRQWVLKITEYAERLLADLDDLDWSDSIKTMQRNWIGKSLGADVCFTVDGEGSDIWVYTTRPDTLFGATYMVLAPEHPLVEKICTADQKEKVDEYIRQSALKSDLERTDLAKTKSGVFSGAYAINPVNKQKIPIWVADYVLISYGSGAIMAVPAHDQRDWEFARKFDLPVVQVLEGGDISQEAFTEDGVHINSGFLNGLAKQEAIDKMITWLEEKGKGKAAVNYKLRDWIFSRQRYWGEPIPLVHCESCGTVPIPENQLPLTLPEVESYKPSGTGESPLAAIDPWVNTKCPVCGKAAKRETNTMPQWAGSCWYYLRYLDPHNQDEPFSKEKEAYWMPVDLYVGGAEHAVLHLLYARFWHKVLFDLNIVSTKEPFQRLINQGMITSFAYQRKNGSLVPVDEVEEVETDKFIEKSTGEALEQVVAKMSKSLKNVINPDDIVREYGADTLRLYEMFMGPLQVSKPWNTKGVVGIKRFLDKIWRLSEEEFTDEVLDKKLEKILHQTIKKVSLDTSNLEFNTAISQMMIFINDFSKAPKVNLKAWIIFLQLLSPYAPHLAEELWVKCGEKGLASQSHWPTWDEEKTLEDEKTIVVQVNGKIRDKFTAASGTNKEDLIKQAEELPKIKEWTKDKTVLKKIAVPDKLVNFVVK